MLFRIEKKLKELPSGERLQKRIELRRPVLEGFWAWVEETSAKYTTNESLKTALTYTANQKRYLETFLEVGRIPISNNDCESYIRPFANGRKAWLFADSPGRSESQRYRIYIGRNSKAESSGCIRLSELFIGKPAGSGSPEPS